MEKADNVAVVPVDMGWNDVGTWSAVHDLVPPDEHGNVILGRALDLDSRDSLIFSQDRLVATIGLKDMIVVDTADATLVCHRERVQDVKNLVAELDPAKPGGVQGASHRGAALGALYGDAGGAGLQGEAGGGGPGQAPLPAVPSAPGRALGGGAGGGPGHHRRKGEPGASQPERLHTPRRPPTAWRTSARSPCASSKSRPGITWRKTTSCAWPTTSGAALNKIYISLD